ncbi:MAG: hypothetical protein RSE04_05915 [Hydrogenoanaerobacterium sp.]
MKKLTKTPEGKVVVFSTMRDHPNRCSESCSGVYRFCGDLYCKHFNEYAEFRCKECIENELKVGV